MTDPRLRKVTITLIVAWALSVTVASALHAFKNDSAVPPIPFLVAAVGPIAIFAACFAASPQFHEFTLSLNPKFVTFVHLWRINGFVFLILMAYGILPSRFAMPAGWGDIFIGATAPFVAFYLTNASHRRTFILWHLLGITDLVVAVGSGATARFFDPQSVSMLPMTVLPLSLVPTFLVPLLVIFHVIAIAQARRWREQEQVRIRAAWPSTAV